MQNSNINNDKNNLEKVKNILNKNIVSETKSITQALCSKYRRFTNFKHNHEVLQGDKLEEEVNYNKSLSLIKKSSSLTNGSNNVNNEPSSPLLLKLRKNITTAQPSSSLSLILQPYNEQKTHQQITNTFTQLNTMIMSISQQFENRMKTHQDQILKIMMLQIKRLNHQCEKTIQMYNQLMKLKSIDCNNDQLLLQLGLYRKHVLTMQGENQMLKKEIQYLKRLNNEYELKIRTDQQTMKELMKKLMHYKNKSSTKRAHTDTLQQITKSTQHIKQTQLITQQKSITKSQFQSIQVNKQSQKHPISYTKPNSRSLIYSRRSPPQYSIDRSIKIMKSPNIDEDIKQNRQQRISDFKSIDCLENNNTMLIKLNNDINQKYKSYQKIEGIQQSIKHSQQQRDQSQLTYQSTNNNNNNPQSHLVSINRQKVIQFLKQSHHQPSIKQIINKKKSLQRKKPHKQFINQTNYSDNKIKIIKNRVRLSSFDQSQFLALKKSLELSLLQREKCQKIVNNGQLD